MLNCVVVVGTPRNARDAVRLHLRRLPGDQLGGLLEIGDCGFEPTRRDVAVAPMPVQPRLSGTALDALAVHVDRLSKAIHVGEAAPQPDDVRVVGIPGEIGAGALQILSEGRLLLFG